MSERGNVVKYHVITSDFDGPGFVAVLEHADEPALGVVRFELGLDDDVPIETLQVSLYHYPDNVEGITRFKPARLGARGSGRYTLLFKAEDADAMRGWRVE